MVFGGMQRPVSCHGRVMVDMQLPVSRGLGRVHHLNKTELSACAGLCPDLAKQVG